MPITKRVTSLSDGAAIALIECDWVPALRQAAQTRSARQAWASRRYVP
jgi:hypothetical protein